MDKTKSLTSSHKVRVVQDAFEHWRSGKKHGREAIPPKLWRMAAALCETYSVNRVARCMGLNHTALKIEVDKRVHQHRHSPAFVELTSENLPAEIIPGHSSAEYVVEVVDPGKPRVHVRGASVLEVAALVRALGLPNGRQPGAGS
jgi:uncharacterized OsmC-like protein